MGQIKQMAEESMRGDSDVKRDVEFELRWTPALDPTDIGWR